MNDQSSQPCGCDPGAGYVCRRHQEAGCGNAFERVFKDHQDKVGQKEAQERNLALYLDGCGVAAAPTRVTTLPQDPKERKKYPIATGVLFYFPDAIAAVARVSFEGNEQHNPGEKLHWARGKSMDQEDTLVRHLMESGTFDTDGQRHSAKAAWRALAMLQLEIERDRQ